MKKPSRGRSDRSGKSKSSKSKPNKDRAKKGKPSQSSPQVFKLPNTRRGGKSLIARAAGKEQTKGKSLRTADTLRRMEEVPPPLTIHPVTAPAEDLPFSYNETKIHLMVRDPFWCYGYWDFSAETWDWIQGIFRQDPGAKSVIRVYDLDGGGREDLEVELDAKNWYLHLGRPDSSFEVDLGLIDSKGKFHLIAKSNRIRTPRNGPSNVIDDEWRPDDFELVYKLSGGGQTGLGSELFSQFKKRPTV